MPSILYFTIPVVIISFLIVVYFAIKDLNIKLNKDLSNVKEREKAISEQVDNILELQKQIMALKTNLDHYKSGTFLLYKFMMQEKTRTLGNSNSLRYHFLVKKHKKVEINYDNSSAISKNQVRTKLSYSNN